MQLHVGNYVLPGGGAVRFVCLAPAFARVANWLCAFVLVRLGFMLVRAVGLNAGGEDYWCGWRINAPPTPFYLQSG